METDSDEEFLGDAEDLLDLQMFDMFLNLGRPVRPRVIRHRPDYYNLFDDYDFIVRFRLDKATVETLYREIAHEIDPNSLRNNAVRGRDRLLLTLRYYATGCFQMVCADFAGVSKTSANDFINAVTHAIARIRPRHVQFPVNQEEINASKTRFYEFARFPNVIAALDCTHVKILSPGINNVPEEYRNRKGYFSINVQGMCDANMIILDAVARWPGSVHDQRIFNNSRIMYRLETGEFGNSLIVGDAGYEDTPYLVTPLLRAGTVAERLYNESQIRTRNVVERTFGVFKRRFPIMAVGMRCSMENVFATIHAVTILHNMAIRQGTQEVEPEVEVDIDEGNINVVPLGLGNDATRRGLIHQYFSTLGG